MARGLAEKKGYLKEFELFETGGTAGAAGLCRGTKRGKRSCAPTLICTRALSYKMLGISSELYTPLLRLRVLWAGAHTASRKFITITRSSVRLQGDFAETTFVPLDER
jgi:hypothetical protein